MRAVGQIPPSLPCVTFQGLGELLQALLLLLLALPEQLLPPHPLPQHSLIQLLGF